MIILVLTIFMINDNADHQKVKLSESMIVLTSYDDDYDEYNDHNDHNQHNHHKITVERVNDGANRGSTLSYDDDLDVNNSVMIMMTCF